MTETRHVVLSPHPDDAVWSSGGRLRCWAGSGVAPTVVTVFDGNGDSPADRWRRVAEPATRRHEDAAALACAGARRVSLGLPDAAVRGDRGVPRYGSPLRLFGTMHERDAELPGEVADAVAGLLGPDVVVHAPLAAGRHVDHRVVRAAAKLLAGRGAQVCYYEDFSYRVRPADHEGLSPEHAEVDVTGWVAAASHYHSQVSALFGSRASFEAALRARALEHAKQTPWLHAERFWKNGARNGFDG
ncbi:MAG TPA: PIG-L family deacetylase [Actinophytocola sp.]|uniref:PIG-L deacetylase family protein n=1 Tax=Actinophytocola sp. TaxID=1872138 RepID=UPI002DBBFA63|nr:PIG-L family deacetylase [Actinophytocola sp.]HEU5473562.1 PIG-L family deacetylase [Actinophytocola sp.]